MANRATSFPNLSTNFFSSSFDKISQFGSIFSEIGIKEYKWIFFATWQSFKYYFCPYHLYNLNQKISKPSEADLNISKTSSIAKVILLIPGQGSSPATYLPLAKKMKEAGILNVYTVKDSGNVSTSNLQKTILKIQKLCTEEGYQHMQLAIIGHSLGSITGAKYVWRDPKPKDVEVSIMFSIAGRLKYIRNKFWWFCEAQKEEIEKTFEAYSKTPEKTNLITIHGIDDGLVPKESVDITRNKQKHHEIEHHGHLGIIFADKTHQIIISELKTWQKNNFS